MGLRDWPDAGPPSLGSQLRFARRRLGWSQEELAARARLSFQLVCELEAGTKLASSAVEARLSSTLGVTIF